MKTINEVNVLTNVHLSNAQKMMMAKVKASANANIASEQVRDSPNLASAQKTLIKLGLLLVDSTGTTITTKGDKVMSDENLTDDTASLTDEGQKFADAKSLTDLASLDKSSGSEKPPEPNVGGEPTEQTPTEDVNMGEGLSLFKDINAMANVKLL